MTKLASEFHAGSIWATKEPRIFALKRVDPKIKLSWIEIWQLSIEVGSMCGSFKSRNVADVPEALPQFNI
jgi:hypothetical protein